MERFDGRAENPYEDRQPARGACIHGMGVDRRQVCTLDVLEDIGFTSVKGHKQLILVGSPYGDDELLCSIQSRDFMDLSRLSGEDDAA